MRRKNLNVATKKIFKLSATLAAVSTLAFAINSDYALFDDGISQSNNTVYSTGHGDVNTLKASLNNWRTGYEAKGGSSQILKLTLGSSKVLSDTTSKGRGHFQFNLKTGEVAFQAKGMEAGQYELWLVDSQNGSVKPKSGDNMIQLGRFEVADGKGNLETHLERSQLMGFTMDSLAVSKAGQTPAENLILTGSPDLMHKLYYADKPWLTTAMGSVGQSLPENTAPFDFLLPKVAQADTISDLTPVLGAKIARGRQIFHSETFAGNGRSCGSCHREDNNFTLDPNYIMTLPQSDPLFVAENNNALADLEDPVLMRKHALIKTNVDGPSVDIFRSVPHTLAMFTSIDHEVNDKAADYNAAEDNFGEAGLGGEFGVGLGGEFSDDNQFAHSTGWSGDGAPGTGSLRDFTLGAISQHMPKTMSRIAGTDFRLPTNEELDDVEAYMLSLGRSKDYPLYQITFKDPLVRAGQELFDTKLNPVDGSGQPIEGETANCNGCHQNAGARSSTTKANPTRNTGIENMKIHPARLLKPDMAYDGGFGTDPAYCGPDADSANCFGDGRFSTATLIEAADTPPYFHNNAVSTLEEAIAAYNSDAFNTSPGSLSSGKSRRVKLDSTQIVAMASFLRTINAIENVRMSNQLANQAKQISNNATARDLVSLAKEENMDAIEVLKEGKLGNNWSAVQKLEKADYFLRLAQLAPVKTLRTSMLTQALNQQAAARNMIAECNPNAALPDVNAPLVRKVPGYSANPANDASDMFLYSCAEIGL
ncbi:MAG: hypothetical protein PHR94_06870 [Methylomonas lenta]|nr:hypothetical protein [Methylomonas lenta]